MGNHPYPSLHLAEELVRSAELAYAEEMRRLFPDETLVCVNHWRGSYRAEVIGRDSSERRLILRNTTTGKRSYAYPSMRAGIARNALPCVVVEG